MRGFRDGTGDPDPPPLTLENHTAIVFHSNAGPDPLENHKTTKPTFNIVPSSAHPAKMPFKWRFAGRSMMAYF